MSYWQRKVVVVTGGTAGLGRSIVAAFAHRGATVISIARNLPDTDAVSAQSNVHHVCGDVMDDASITAAVESIVREHQQIYVWVNNVGRSLRASFDSTTVADYREYMEVNFLSAVRCSIAALPLLEQSSGSIVNIGSLSSRTGWPLIAPYVTSKHALAGYAHQLRLEGPANVHSLFVCPGPIARDDSATRYADATSELGDAANRPAAGAKISGIDPALLADRIVAACETRKPEIVLPLKARWLFAITQISPRAGDWLLRRFGGSKKAAGS